MKKMIGFFVCIILLFSCNDEAKTAESTSSETSNEKASSEMKSYEIGDDKFKQIGKKGLEDLASGDVDSWMNSYADNAIYRWSGGDSLNGKTAIAAYWKKRRAEVIDSLSYSNEIWLPMKVNIPQSETQLPGNYVLGWYRVHAKYKTGKSMSQRSHVVIHFDANDKIDRVTQYLDMALINAAAAK